MAKIQIIFIAALSLLNLFNLSAQETSLEVIVRDGYNENPLEYALVSILKDGIPIDSAYTDVNGIANIHTVVGVKERETLPYSISLSHNYPNPFRETTDVELGVEETQSITATVYNILGQRVISEQLTLSGGFYKLNLSLGNFPTGVYLLHIGGRKPQTIKLLKMEGLGHSYTPALTISPISQPVTMHLEKMSTEGYFIKIVKENYHTYESPISLSEELSVSVSMILSQVNDIEGNIYRVNMIGGQCWMSENLKTKKYSNGDDISLFSADPEWQNTMSGAYIIFPHGQIDQIDSEEDVIDAYGNLYNWYAAVDPRGLCPSGWHVPGDNEWTILTDYLGGWSIAGGKMKSTRTDPDTHPRWISPNFNATDESGFSGLPGGYNAASDYFYNHSSNGYWWSSSEYSGPGVSGSWHRQLYHNNHSVTRSALNRHYGYSVRCLRD